VFKKAFGTFGKAAEYFKVTRRTIARWARLTPHPPRWVAEAMQDLLQKNVEAAHEAQNELKYYLAEPARPLRRLTGATARYQRKSPKPW
jgi:hypothetical protein